VIVVTISVGRAAVTTTDTQHNSPGVSGLPEPGRPERRLLERPVMSTYRRDALAARLRTANGFSLLEVLMVVALIGILAAIAIGVTPEMIRTAKGQSGVQELAAFLKRHREMAVSRRRNIEITFTAPNVIASFQRAVPNPPAVTPPPTPLETVRLEGGVEFQLFAGVPDTPDAFGNAAAINLGGADPVMFTSEGAFTDANGDPINASLFVALDGHETSVNALTIVGTTAAVRTWRWDGGRWVQ
jgi:prepilin-type N-terminal cleavage/methylation domain-containing protein